MKQARLLVLAGPTASGKTEIALEVSKLLPVETLSFDSMQAYRGMPLTTQAPPRASNTRLVSFLSPSREYSAALFREKALSLIPKILRRKKIPLLVGGTGLYLRALLDGLFEPAPGMPVKDEALRKKLQNEALCGGSVALHRKLAEVDPPSARKIHPNDTRRIIRALEVFMLTAHPLSLQKPNREGIRGKFDFKIFFLERERRDLYRRIERRVDEMIRLGLVDEARALFKKKLSRTAGMALGIREMRSYLEGHLALAEATELLKKNTRHYAKRQIAWFRHEEGVETVPVGPREPAAETAVRIVRKWKAASPA